MISKKLVEIFQNEFNYNKINKIRKTNMRNILKGIQLNDAIYYRFLYTKKDTTEESIVSHMNFLKNTTFTRQAYTSKEKNIPTKTYFNVLSKIKRLYNDCYGQGNDLKMIAVDGTYNNDIKMKEVLNMGFFDITNNIPIELKSYGNKNKNREISSTIDFIKKNINIFKNSIIVGDRGYFSYEFLNFLINNNLKFIIRVKGKGENLNQNNVLKPNTPKYKSILNVRENSILIKNQKILCETMYASHSKKKVKKYKIEKENNCNIITNLKENNKKYSEDKIWEIYKSRWDVEVFFKYIKYNFKFQHMGKKSLIARRKMCICELIITYLEKLLEKYAEEKNFFKKTKSKRFDYKINKSNLTKGIFDYLIYNILNNTIKNETFDHFCKCYINVTQNKIDRNFPRMSKKPFTKWYIKGYYHHTKFMKIVNAILNGQIDKLNKNLKTIAKNIISVDGVQNLFSKIIKSNN